MQRALAVALDHGCDTRAARAYTNFYGNLVDAGLIAEGERVFLDGITFCEEHDAATFTNCLLATRAEALEADGRWDESLALAQEQVAHAVLSPINRMHFLVSMAGISARRGAPEAADLLDRCVSEALSTGEPQWVVPTALARADWHWFAGRDGPAIDDVQLALDRAEGPRLVAMASVWARRVGLDVPVPVTAGASPYDTALALLDSDDPDDWLAALPQLDDLGAVPAASFVRRRLREAGVRSIPNGVRATTREHPAGLTAREQEVLARVCAGMTNEQIARALFISAKTVGHHVSAVLSKLGVHTGQDAAAAALARGLTPQPRGTGAGNLGRRSRSARAQRGAGSWTPDPRPKEHPMPLFMDVHSLADGVAPGDVAKAHMADLQTQSKYDVNYLRYWVDESEGKIFCLVEAPSADAAATVHKEAHGPVADEIYAVREGS
ncbi:nickel-binding protein [Nocardioides sp. B-3]|uniref:nickel-binding protein n=1 Tax=Nocardioides sp. B-3 TaxID=2895565 RepID=UPI0021529DF5|nr:nickel-binding protein [Nocardioides sp. B-3]UUZ58893.1 DUF4242 domain-containing protein [Nocardioides sp. B-3]